MWEISQKSTLPHTWKNISQKLAKKSDETPGIIVSSSPPEVCEFQAHPFAPHVVSSMPQWKKHSQLAAAGGGCVAAMFNIFHVGRCVFF